MDYQLSMGQGMGGGMQKTSHVPVQAYPASDHHHNQHHNQHQHQKVETHDNSAPQYEY
jgi:hypothetical protein